MDKKTIVVVGAGQGLGNHVAKRFGKEGFRVVLMARDGKSLKRYQQEFAENGIETFVHEADAERTETLDTAFAWVKGQFGTPDVLIYNVGITAADEPDKMTSAELMRHYQTDVASAWHCARLVADEDFGKKQGVILFTAADWQRFRWRRSRRFPSTRRHSVHWLACCTTNCNRKASS